MLSILDSKSLKMSDLCRYLNINTSTMTNWKNRGTDPPAKYIVPICEFLNISCEHLLTGKATPISTGFSVDDTEWLSLIHQLPPTAQHEFKGEIKGYLKRLNEESIAVDKSLKKTGTDSLGK
ncbi:MAG: bacteriophage CI repressor [Lachnospiraceae bacterium]|nr:bacteriophage CI repressor [Lachnospiraceae bacterium]